MASCRFGDPRLVDAITAAELRAWLLELRGSTTRFSVAIAAPGAGRRPAAAIAFVSDL